MSGFSLLILTIGIPGSGKSRWVSRYKKENPTTFIISTDALRKEITGVEQCIDPSQNKMIHDEARKRVKDIINDPNSKGHGLGPVIIVDSTNCNVSEWIQYKELGATIMIAKVFETDPDTAMKYQQLRERQVPREIVEMKWKELKENEKYLRFIFNMIDYIPKD